MLRWARDGQRGVETEAVRVISQIHGGSHFTNAALKLIVDNLKGTAHGLKRVFVFTDECRAQYKGKNSSARIAHFSRQSIMV